MAKERLRDFNWVLGAFAVAIALSAILAMATKHGTGTDASGIATGTNPSALIGVAPGTITQASIDAAKTAEPFATQLATLVNQNRLGINYVWTLVAGFLVFFMQLGFALLETGCCRRKNALHVMGLNLGIYFVGLLGYFLLGFAFQFGGVGNVGVGNLGGLASLNNWVSIGGWHVLGWTGFGFHRQYDVGVAVMFLFQMVFMDTAATIPTGAMAERWKWSAFMVYGLFISTIIYPIYGMWAWGGGWLSQMGAMWGLGQGYLDFAGSGVVHAVGGWTALAGAIVLGSRIGKFNKDGSSNSLPGHSLVMALAGCLILAFGWFGFNPGSTLGAAGNGNLRIGMIAVCTMLASAAGGVVAMLYMWWTTGKPDIAMSANGFLGGLVAITAPSGYVSPFNAVIIGAIAGLVIPLAAGFIENVLKVDDPVGAVAVHGFGGLWGQLALGLFADGTMNYGGLTAKGLFYGDSGQFLAQLIGAAVAFVWSFGLAFAFFKALDWAMGIRVTADEEIAGLDLAELGAAGYWDGDEPTVGAWPLPALEPVAA